MRALLIRLFSGKHVPKPTLKELTQSTVYTDQLIDFTNKNLFVALSVERVH